MSKRITWLTAIVTVTILGGCSDGGNSPSAAGTAGGGDPDVPDTGGDPGGDPGAETRAGLRPLGDRDTFFEELRGSLVAQYAGGDDTFVDQEFLETDADTAADSDAPAESAVPESADSADGAAGDGERLEVTETNVQELGVDEQDRVKVSSDGTRLYVLQQSHGDVFPTEPFLVDDVAPDDVAVDSLPGGLPPPEGPSTTLRVLGLDAAAADATPLRDIELDLNGRNADGMYLYEGDAGNRVLLTASGGGYWGYWDSSASFGGLDSVVTRIDVDDPSSAAIDGSFRIDGQIVSSRRIGKYLFFASRFYPTLPGPQPRELSAGEWEAAVANADDESLLPGYTDVDTGVRTSLVDPGSCFVARKPVGQPWYSPDIVTLAVIDLDTMSLADSECYLGASETLYASPDGVYLATTRYEDGGVVIVDGPAPVDPVDGEDIGVDSDGEAVDVDPPVVIVEPGDPSTSEPAFQPRRPTVETDVHQFDIDGGSLAYRGSGSVRGHLGFDLLRKPFRMSARNGDLRVATVNDTFGVDDESVSPINVTVLRPDGEGALVRIAELPNAANPAFIGKPGESLYASRFIGDRAYLVTFRQTDPLYVVDLADPENPSVLGELEIDGYSDYLMPIGENHLLGIGRDAVASPDSVDDGRGALVLGIKLSLFDVSDPGNPLEADTLLVGQRGSDAEALFDHRGITVQRATDTHPTRVSFGVDVHGTAFPTDRPDPNSPVGLPYYDWSYTGLHGFDVTGGDGAGIVQRGAMIVERRGQGGQLFGPSVYAGDRSVMVNDATYYVHGDRVYAAPWDTLSSPSEAR